MCRMGPEGWTKIVTQSIDTINEADPENVGVTIFISMSEVYSVFRSSLRQSMRLSCNLSEISRS